MPATSFRIEPLAKRHDRSSFSCGRQELDEYLQTQAGQEMRRRVAAVYVLTEGVDSTVLGYYTLSAHTVDASKLPQDWARKLPRYPALPATLIGRLAVDRTTQGQGHGVKLVFDALRRAYSNSSEVGSAAIVVDALDDQAKRFYLKVGFEALLDTPRRLFLPMSSIQQLVPDRLAAP